MFRFVRSGALVLVFGALLLPLPAAAQPVLSVSPSSLSLQGNVGSNVASSIVRISNAGNRSLKWSIVSPTATWLTVSPPRGVNSGTLTVSFQTSGLAAGQHSASFRVESESGTAITVSVQVNLVAVTTTVAKLAVSCPSNRTVSSATGSAIPVTYTATTSGGVAPVTVSGSPASGSLFPVGTTTVQVNAKSGDGQTASCNFPVTVTSTIAKLYVNCPSNMAVASPNGSAVAVTYSASTSGGVAPVSMTGSPASGSLFPVATTTVQMNAKSSDGQTATCSFAVTVSYTPTLPTSSYGPSASITCPAGAVDIWPGSAIQSIVNNHAAGATFCLRAGVHSVTASITPKTGNTFVGEYGAILDGTGWSASESTQAAFRAHNENIDYVTIRNLVIRKMPQRGIHAFYYMSDHWTIEYNEIASNLTGIVFPSSSTIRNNNIHHNTSGGYLGTYSSYSTIENNEIAYNGPEQKVGESANVTFRNNFVHHNGRDGIWFDSNNTGIVIEGNRVEDNGQMGIFYEISTDGIIRNNTVRRSGDAAVFISTSKNSQIYNNTLENNFRSITFFVNCSSVGGGSINFDLTNNSAHDNHIVVGAQTDVFAAGVSYISCTSTQAAPYLNGSKNLKFFRNTYKVPSVTGGRYWLWNGLLYWSQWQSLGQDLDSVITQ